MTEIERTFRLDRLPDERSEPTRIEQAYIALDDHVEVRVRRRDGTYTLTVKGGNGLERTDVDLPIDGDAGESLWPLGAGRTIDKRRSTVDLGEHTAEIDEYHGRAAADAVSSGSNDADVGASGRPVVVIRFDGTLRSRGRRGLGRADQVR